MHTTLKGVDATQLATRCMQLDATNVHLAMIYSECTREQGSLSLYAGLCGRGGYGTSNRP